MKIREFNIETIEDVKEWFKYLVDIELLLHPDDDYKWILEIAEEIGEEPEITLEQAEYLNKQMDKCFEICEKCNEDIYDLAGWEAREAINIEL